MTLLYLTLNRITFILTPHRITIYNLLHCQLITDMNHTPLILLFSAFLLVGGCGEDTPTLDSTGSPVRPTEVSTCTSSPSFNSSVAANTLWKAAPGDALITHPISGLSVRQSFAPHGHGDVIRLRLSNRYSNLPVTLRNVYLAQEASPGSASMLPNTFCLLSFNGEHEVTLEPGETLTSDWMSYRVEPFKRLGVSFYAPGVTPQVTRHLNANEVLYLSLPGDHTAQASGSSYLPAPDGYTANFLVIEALETLRSNAVTTLVTVGDSITDGADSTTGLLDGQASPLTATDQRYPNHLQRRLIQAGLPLTVANAGIGGNELLKDGWLPQFGKALLTRFDSDVLHTPGLSHILLMIGTNDFGNPKPAGSPSVEQMIAGYTTLIDKAHKAGVKIVLGTIPPAEGTVTELLPVLHGTAEARRKRDQTNAWIRTQTQSDGIVDFEACLENKKRKGYMAPQYNSGDNLHPNPAGYAAMADCINLDLFR